MLAGPNTTDQGEGDKTAGIISTFQRIIGLTFRRQEDDPKRVTLPLLAAQGFQWNPDTPLKPSPSEWCETLKYTSKYSPSPLQTHRYL